MVFVLSLSLSNSLLFTIYIYVYHLGKCITRLHAFGRHPHTTISLAWTISIPNKAIDVNICCEIQIWWSRGGRWWRRRNSVHHVTCYRLHSPVQKQVVILKSTQANNHQVENTQVSISQNRNKNLLTVKRSPQ